jgi:hypothetical protein
MEVKESGTSSFLIRPESRIIRPVSPTLSDLTSNEPHRETRTRLRPELCPVDFRPFIAYNEGMQGTALPVAWVVKCTKCGCVVNCRAIDPQREHAEPDKREPAPNYAVIVACSCCWSAFRYAPEAIFYGSPKPNQECSARRAREIEKDKVPSQNGDRLTGALLVASSLIAAVRLSKEEIKSTPRVHSRIADSITLARMILKHLEH